MTQSRSLSVFPSFSIPDTALSCNKYNFLNVDNAGTKNLNHHRYFSRGRKMTQFLSFSVFQLWRLSSLQLQQIDF